MPSSALPASKFPVTVLLVLCVSTRIPSLPFPMIVFPLIWFLVDGLDSLWTSTPSWRFSFTRFAWTMVEEAPCSSMPSKLRATQLQKAVPFDASLNSMPSLGASTTFRNMMRMFVDIMTLMASSVGELTVEVRSPGRRPSAGHPLRVSAGAMPRRVRSDRPRIKIGPAAPRDRDRGTLRRAVDCLLQVVEDSGRGLARRDGHRARLEGRAAAVVARVLRRYCVRRAVVVDAVAALGHVARAGGGPALGGALGVGGAVGGRARADVVHVAQAGRGAAHGGRRLEVVGGAVVVHAVAALGHVAGAGGGPALGGALGVGGAVGGRARAEVVRVAHGGRGAAHGARRLEVVAGQSS